MAEFPNFKGSWPWPWHWIGSRGIPSCITHLPLPTYQISLKSNKLFVDGRTDGWTYGQADGHFSIHVIRSTETAAEILRFFDFSKWRPRRRSSDGCTSGSSQHSGQLLSTLTDVIRVNFGAPSTICFDHRTNNRRQNWRPSTLQSFQRQSPTGVCSTAAEETNQTYAALTALFQTCLLSLNWSTVIIIILPNSKSPIFLYLSVLSRFSQYPSFATLVFF